MGCESTRAEEMLIFAEVYANIPFFPGHEAYLQVIECLFSRVRELACMTELERYTEGDLDDGMAIHARLVLIEVPEKERDILNLQAGG